jgi:hypothetical protein
MLKVTVASLRADAERLGFRGYSRMRLAELKSQLETVTVWKGDTSVTRKVGSAFLRKCKVAEWEGNERYGYRPAAWLVPRFALKGAVPLKQTAVAEKRSERSAKLQLARERRVDEVASRIGALPGSRIATAVMRGDVDAELGELIAFRASFRHEHTDYDELIRQSGDRDDARSSMVPTDAPQTWDEYLRVYEFGSAEAKALAATLRDPGEAHPCWFKEAEIAVRIAVRTGRLALENLSYQAVAGAIRNWRSDREFFS